MFVYVLFYFISVMGCVVSCWVLRVFGVIREMRLRFTFFGGFSIRGRVRMLTRAGFFVTGGFCFICFLKFL